MKKQDFLKYYNEGKLIQIKLHVTNRDFFYKGYITFLSEDSMVFKDYKIGEITIDYNDIVSPVIPIDFRSLGGKNG